MSKFNIPKLNSAPTNVYDNLLGEISEIVEIPIKLIDDFYNHTYNVLLNSDMEELADSIKTTGQLSPALVREKENGRYELISGHRRKKACEIAGLSTLKCEVKKIPNDYDAVIAMGACNFQREKIMPSEKAATYKLMLEAIKLKNEREKEQNLSKH